MRNSYNTPLNTRYASKEMSYLFSDDKNSQLGENLWVALSRN